MERPLAVITGASSGIGFELARCCVEDGRDAILCADGPDVVDAAGRLARNGAQVQPLQADLATLDGVNALVAAIGARPVDALLANAGAGLRGGFLDQDIAAAQRVIALNVSGTLALVHAVGRAMRDRGHGRILIVGSIAGFAPGSFNAVYNASKAFVDSFAFALREELRDTGVTVTCLMPGLTDTAFFERAGLEDTPIGRSSAKADPAAVARDGYDAMMAGRSGVVSGFVNKLQTAFAGVIPDAVLAAMHRRLAEPGR
jgi:short-subunit dehydrogenase